MYRATAYARTRRRGARSIKPIRGAIRTYRRRRRRIFRRRRGFKRTFATGIPYQTIIRFKLRSDVIEINPATTVRAFTFNLNEIYDPLSTHGTSQPYLYDHYNNLYATYRVISGIWYINVVNSTANPIRISASISEDSTTASSYRILAEQQNGRSFILTEAGGTRSMKTFKMPWNVNRYFKGYSLDDQNSAFGTNPVARLYLHVYIQSFKYDGSPANLVGSMNITAYFRTILSDYKRQAISSV